MQFGFRKCKSTFTLLEVTKDIEELRKKNRNRNINRIFSNRNRCINMRIDCFNNIQYDQILIDAQTTNVKVIGYRFRVINKSKRSLLLDGRQSNIMKWTRFESVRRHNIPAGTRKV